MPPKCKFTPEEVVQAALDMTREGGIGCVTARAVGARLNSSSKVIFSLFQNMEELQGAVIRAANDLYQSYLRKDMSSGRYPVYKASGMAYIRFAREERELFKLLFMRDRTGEPVDHGAEELKPLIELIQKNTGLSEQQAYLFHLEMWVYVHGIATMIATAYLEWDWDMISTMVTDAYEGMRSRYLSKEGS